MYMYMCVCENWCSLLNSMFPYLAHILSQSQVISKTELCYDIHSDMIFKTDYLPALAASIMSSLMSS